MGTVVVGHDAGFEQPGFYPQSAVRRSVPQFHAVRCLRAAIAAMSV